MADDLGIAIKRLEEALKILRSGQFDEWYEAYRIADYKSLADESEDWAAIRDLIVIATHGAPHQLSYLDEALTAMIFRDKA